MNPLKSFFVILIIFAVAAIGNAQQTETGPPATGGPPQQRDGERPNLLRELGLSPDQLQLIRKMNAERKPQMEAAQRTLRDSMRALDAAIYADVVNENDVSLRIKDFQAAQAEIARIRFNNELTVRQILSPDQLLKFRELRKRFEEERQIRRESRKNGGGSRPFERMYRRNRPPGNSP